MRTGFPMVVSVVGQPRLDSEQRASTRNGPRAQALRASGAGRRTLQAAGTRRWWLSMQPSWLSIAWPPVHWSRPQWRSLQRAHLSRRLTVLKWLRRASQLRSTGPCIRPWRPGLRWRSPASARQRWRRQQRSPEQISPPLIATRREGLLATSALLASSARRTPRLLPMAVPWWTSLARWSSRCLPLTQRLTPVMKHRRLLPTRRRGRDAV
mmetsp:Transcript_31045/g.92366  ORF Transcript_31045/g.92366 Transcript_31045/m.92366 type:complete len:210 (-) Transcript_31045:405-1034(-)